MVPLRCVTHCAQTEHDYILYILAMTDHNYYRDIRSVKGLPFTGIRFTDEGGSSIGQ